MVVTSTAMAEYIGLVVWNEEPVPESDSAVTPALPRARHQREVQFLRLIHT